MRVFSCFKSISWGWPIRSDSLNKKFVKSRQENIVNNLIGTLQKVRNIKCTLTKKYAKSRLKIQRQIGVQSVLRENVR